MAPFPVRPDPDPEALRRELLDLGFTLCGFAPPAPPAAAGEAFRAWLEAGRAGDMATWLERSAAIRADPGQRFDWARTAVALALAYDRPEDRAGGVLPRISRYAQGRSYHNVIGKRLKHVCRALVAHGAEHAVGYVDTGPVLERSVAAQAGLGWLGKNTMLLHPQWGSMLFLAVVYTDLELPPDRPMTDHCGSCRACLDVCPTDAFPAAGELDATRCISYLNIEHRGAFETPFDASLHGWLQGCDLCQEACPFVAAARRRERWGDPDFAPRESWRQIGLVELAEIAETEWDRLTRGSDVRRGGPGRLRRVAGRLSGDSPPR